MKIQNICLTMVLAVSTVHANRHTGLIAAHKHFSRTLNTTQASNQTEQILDQKEPISSHRLAAVQAVETKEPKGVFAHFMVGNVESWDVDAWKRDMQLAKDAKIDGFALNMAYNEAGNLDSVSKAFAAARQIGFKLIFSFDYAGNGPWPIDDVSLLLFGYTPDPAYYRYKGKPMVSTFEGWENSEDWSILNKAYGLFFIPDWSSLGANDAMRLKVAHGLFSWAGWPWGNTDMNTYVDASYEEFLNGSEYMMPVSPWFYTNMPGYDKNWLWRGDSLWYDRWEQVLKVQPQFVQIISWNDYGESHYIGPLHAESYKAFNPGFGDAPFNYVQGMFHDSWRNHLPFVIDLYKTGNATVTKENLVVWFRPTLTNACGTGQTVGNTASQLLIEFEPQMVAQDKIFFTALLGSDSTVGVSIGGVELGGEWENKPPGGVGLYHGTALIGGRTGAVNVKVIRNGVTVLIFAGKSITNVCPAGIQNWNAFVGSVGSSAVISKKAMSVDLTECIAGWGPGDFGGLCGFACGIGYCPLSACVCTSRGIPNKKPTWLPTKGYPGPGKTASYEGLCAFTCSYGYCPAPACSTKQTLPYAISTVSPFLPAYCVKGTGTGGAAGLCSYACAYGFCPILACKCVQEGNLQKPPAKFQKIDSVGVDWEDHGLCKFACERGYCPDSCTYNEILEDFPSPPPCVAIHPYTTLQAIDDAATSIPEHCVPIYIAELLRTTLVNALSEYNTIMQSSYDKYFGLYAEQMADSATTILRKFYLDKGNSYFTCIVTEPERCCSFCTRDTGYAAGTGPCRYCKGDTAHCATGTSTGAVTFGNYSEPCPPDASLRAASNPTMFWTLRPSEATRFWDDLAKETGFTQDFVTVNPRSSYLKKTILPPCTSGECLFRDGFDFGVPTMSGYTKETVPNPKDIISEALKLSKDLPADLDKNIQLMRARTYKGYPDDVVDAVSVPILMITEAVQSMKEVVKAGEKIEAAKKRQFIMLFLSAFLMLVPALGQAFALVPRFALLGRGIAYAGEAGAVGLEIYDVVSTGGNSPLEIFGIILGLGALADIGKVSKAASIRRAMPGSTVAKLGETITGKLNNVDSAMRACRKL